MRLEVKDIHIVKSRESAIKAFCDVIIGDFQINSVRLMEGKAGVFLALPDKRVEDESTGEVSYEPYCTIVDKSILKELHHLIYTAYQEKAGK